MALGGRFRAALNRGRNPQNSPRRQARPMPAADDLWLHPAEVPQAHEGGESMWDAFHEESRRLDLQFADTLPSSSIPLSGDGQADGPQEPACSGRWTLDEVLVMARRHNRVCPRQMLWSALYILLEGDRYADLAPPPVQPWQWNTLSNLQRRLCFREHIAWADRHGKLQEVARYLHGMAEPDWVHMGDG